MLITGRDHILLLISQKHCWLESIARPGSEEEGKTRVLGMGSHSRNIEQLQIRTAGHLRGGHLHAHSS